MILPTVRLTCVFALLSATLLLLACGTSRQVSKPQGDEYLLMSSSAAQQAFVVADYEQSVRLYRQSLQRAYLVDDATAISETSIHLAAALGRQGEYAEAKELLSRARQELSRRQGQSLDVLKILEARMAYLSGQQAIAQDLLTQVNLLEASSSTRQGYHLLAGELACDAGDLAEASLHLAQMERDASGQQTNVSGKWRLRGRIAELKDDFPNAARCFDKESALLRKSGSYLAMGRALFRSGSAWEGAGKQELAADRYLRAGRSLLLQGFVQEGSRSLEKVCGLAADSQDTSLCEEAERWLESPESALDMSLPE